MEQESIVYGYIRDLPGDEAERSLRRRVNAAALAALPDDEGYPLLPRSLFAVGTDWHSQLIHFGGSYRAIEYEWEQWLARFEALLSRMYWVSATVHLQTELSGNHTFLYEPRGGVHRPGDGLLSLRCEWEHDLLFGAGRRA